MLAKKINKGYHKLLVWEKARKFVSLIYRETENFPHSEIFGLRFQIRRASVSVILNIVEGHRRRSTKEFLRFLDTADASLTEVEACLELSPDLGYINKSKYEKMEAERSELVFMLIALMKSLRKKQV